MKNNLTRLPDIRPRLMLSGVGLLKTIGGTWVDTTKTQAQIDYETDVKRKPNYHDGTPRKKWSELREIEQYSWGKSPFNKK